MAGDRIPLPRYGLLPEGVYFHREDPSDDRVILQIPNADRTDSETHIISLEDTIHKGWLEGLKNSRALLTTLQWAQHIAYCPRTGYFEEMADLDEPNEMQKIVAFARKEASFAASADRFSALHRRRKMPAKASPLRRALSAGRMWR